MGIVRTDSRTISPHMAVSADDAAKLPKPPSAGFGKDQKLKAEQAKAKRVNANFGQGGVRKSRQGAKRSEQKAAASGRGFGTKSSGGLNYDRRPKPTASCGCGSGRSYGECCSLVHERGGATSTEELVRARFTAFSYRLPDFLMATTDPEGAEWNEDAAAWKKSLLTFCDDFAFQTLEIVDVDPVADDAENGRVAFRANFVQKGTINLVALCEHSTFRRQIDGTWLYVDGKVEYAAPS